MIFKPDEVIFRLNTLANREWPKPNRKGLYESGCVPDFSALSHKFSVNPCLSEEEVKLFEEKNSIKLPVAYREFLLKIGNGGAGPGSGMHPLGEDSNGPLGESVMNNLGKWFLHQFAWDRFTGDDSDLEFGSPPDQYRYYSDDIMMGAMPVSEIGCGMSFWLVVAGPAKGQIWIDQRSDGNGIAPVEDDEEGENLLFREWYLNWLQETEEKWN